MTSLTTAPLTPIARADAPERALLTLDADRALAAADPVPVAAPVPDAVPDVVRAGVGVLAAVVACGSACYLAPIEFAAGRWLGLPPWQAWTITAAVEGLTLAALLAGRLAGGLLPTALVLTWVSAAVGTLHAAAEAAHHSGRTLDGQAAASALLVCLLMVLAPALMHRLRVRVHAEHAAALHAARAEAAAVARELADREAAERAEQRAAAERDAAAGREHELAVQRARAYAEQEQARLQLEHVRAEQARAEAAQAAVLARATAEQQRAAIEREQVAAEQARADAERQRARAEHERAATQRRVEQERADAEQQRAAMRADRELARAHWAERETTGPPMTVAEIADLLAISDGRARAVVADWRRRSTSTPPEPEAAADHASPDLSNGDSP